MALTDNLVAYWKLGEASGSRADSAGANTLTDVNTVTQTTGKVGNAAQFTAANSEQLTRADNAALSAGNVDFMFAVWVKLDTKAANRSILAKGTGTGGAVTEYYLFYSSVDDRFEFFVGDGTNLGTVKADNFGSPSTGTWYFITAWHDAAADQIGIQVNNGTPNTTAHSTGVIDTTATFRIGANPAGTGAFWDGGIDELGLWKRKASAAEITALYNGGAGQTHPFIDTGVLAQTLGALTRSAAGAVKVAGVAARTLAALTSAASGTVKVAGATARTLAAATLSAAGVAKVRGASAKTLAALTSAGAGAVRVVGQTGATLQELTVAGAGTVPGQGIGAGALEDAGLTATGAVRVTGHTAAYLAAIAADATSQVVVRGAALRTLAPLTLEASGQAEQIVDGAAAIVLAALLAAAAGQVHVAGQGARTLANVSVDSAGGVQIRGLASITFSPLELLAAGRRHELAPVGRTAAVGASSRRAGVGQAARVIVVEQGDRVSHA